MAGGQFALLPFATVLPHLEQIRARGSAERLCAAWPAF
jgi:hypothetical protein